MLKFINDSTGDVILLRHNGEINSFVNVFSYAIWPSSTNLKITLLISKKREQKQ